MPSIPTTIHFEGLTISSPDDIVEYLRKGTTTRPGDDYPFEWAVRFAADSPSNHKLLGQAISIILERAFADGKRPTDLGMMIPLAYNAQIHGHADALLHWLDTDTAAWSDSDAESYLQDLFSCGHAPLSAQRVEQIRTLCQRPGCYATGLVLVLNNWPWDAAALVRAGATDAWNRGETGAATKMTHMWSVAQLPYRAEMMHAFMACPRELQAAARDAMSELFSPERLERYTDFMAAFAAGDAEEAAIMTHELAQEFSQAAQGGSDEAADLLVHPRDLDGHPWADQAKRDQAALPAFLATAKGGPERTDFGAPKAVLTEGTATLFEVAVGAAGSSAAGEILVYRIGHRFKVGLERPA